MTPNTYKHVFCWNCFDAYCKCVVLCIDDEEMLMILMPWSNWDCKELICISIVSPHAGTHYFATHDAKPSKCPSIIISNHEHLSKGSDPYHDNKQPLANISLILEAIETAKPINWLQLHLLKCFARALLIFITKICLFQNDMGLKSADCASIRGHSATAEFLLMFETSLGITRWGFLTFIYVKYHPFVPFQKPL